MGVRNFRRWNFRLQDFLELSSRVEYLSPSHWDFRRGKFMASEQRRLTLFDFVYFSDSRNSIADYTITDVILPGNGSNIFDKNTNRINFREKNKKREWKKRKKPREEFCFSLL